MEERKSAFDSLSAKLSSTESELLLSRKMCSEQKALMNKLTVELQEERESNAAAVIQHRKRMNEVMEKNHELENMVNTLERRNKSFENKIHT